MEIDQPTPNMEAIRHEYEMADLRYRGARCELRRIEPWMKQIERSQADDKARGIKRTAEERASTKAQLAGILAHQARHKATLKETGAFMRKCKKQYPYQFA
jgi:hypothetical protein